MTNHIQVKGNYLEKNNIFKNYPCPYLDQLVNHKIFLSNEFKNIKTTVIICTSCKAAGHLAKDCPKDPNTRTGANPIEELARISQLKTPKIATKCNTKRKYEADDDGFKDIDALKATLKEKQKCQPPPHVNTLISISTEEAEFKSLKNNNHIIFKS